ncbi:hypothetical protein Tco_0053098 [Tanacetum coccineum]
MSTSSLQVEKTVYTSLTREEKSLIYNTTFLGEYECSSLALDRRRKKIEGKYSTSLRKESQKQIAELVLEEYITVTRKNYISDNDEGKIIEKSFLELKGTFLVKIHDYAFSATSDLFKEECLGSVTSWVDLTEKFFGKFYSPSRTNKEMKADKDEVSWDQTNNEFENCDKELKNDTEPCICKEEDSEVENEIAEIFRIKTDTFDYESPLCKAFDEFNYLFQIDPNIPWVNEKPWKLDGKWKEPTPIKHHCKPFCFKSRHSKWPTCSWREGKYCSGGNLLGQIQVSKAIYYQDYKWYEALELSDLKEEALRNKVVLEISMNYDEESSDDGWSNYSPIDEWRDSELVSNRNTNDDPNYNPYLDIS